MGNERKKKPLDETQTDLDLPVEGASSPPPPDEPEIEVRLPDPADAPDPEPGSPEADAPAPEPAAPEPVEVGEPFADLDAPTQTEVQTGPLDAIVPESDDARPPEIAHLEADPPTETALGGAEAPTETEIPDGATQTEVGPPPTGWGHGPRRADEPSDDPPTMTDVSPGGVEAWKALSRDADETHTHAGDDTHTAMFPDDPETADAEEEDDDPETATRALAPGDDGFAACPDDVPTDDLAPEDIPGGDAPTADLEQTRSLTGPLGPEDPDDVSTGDLAPAPPPPPTPQFEAVHVEVPAGTFVDTFFERRDEEDDDDGRGEAPRSSRSWRDRLERAKPSPWRDLGLWALRRADPRAWWNRLKARRRRRSGEEPTNQQVAKDAARAIASFVASVARPRAEIAAEHNKAWWRRTIVEIAALFLMVVPVEASLTGGVGSFGTHPHPYWLIVIPMACARGVVAGLLAAGIASLLFAAGAVGALQAEDLSAIFEFRHMVEPILFFLVGFFCGELHDELASRYRKLERRMEDVQERNQSLRQERDVLRDANRELERRIVDASVQFGNLIVSAERIENSGRTEVFEVALELVEEHCGAAASVVLVLEDGSLDFLATRGWPEEETSERLDAARASAIVQGAIADGRTVNGFSDEEETPPSGPLVAAPLFDRSGLVQAILCLDEIPATRLNESTITTFLGIAQWISAALGRVTAAERRGETAVATPAGLGANRLGTCDELGQRLRLELERCSRYGVPTSFLAVQLVTWNDTTRDGLQAADRFVTEQFTAGLRPSDNIYRFGYPGCYLLVLAGTDVAGAEVVRTRLLRRVEYAATPAIGPVEIFATGPDADAPDLVSLAERVAKRFRAHSELALQGDCPIVVPERGEPGTFAELQQRLRMETSLAVRNGFELHVIGFRTAVKDVAVGVTLARHLSEVGARLLRATDGVYLAAENCTAVVLPSTGWEETARTAQRLLEALYHRDPNASYGALDSPIVGLDENHRDARTLLEAIGVEGVTEGVS